MNNTIFGGTTTTPIPLAITDQTYNPESTNAQSGIAVAEAVSGKADIPNNYELIETITLTEEVENLYRNVEPNGTPYNFTSIYAKITCPKTDTARESYFGCHYKGSADNGYMFISSTTNATSYSWFRCDIVGGKSFSYLSNLKSSPFGTNYMSSTEVRNYDKIVQFEMRKANAYPLPSGMTIEIWGVRA